jgi:hypothetical protein
MHMRRWLVPFATAVAVVLLLGGMWYFAGPGSKGGDGSFAGGGASFAGGGDGAGSGAVGAGSGAVGGSEPGFPGTPEPGIVPPSDALEDPPAADDPGFDEPDDPLAVLVGGYRRDTARRLSVHYTIGVPECYGKIAEPQVEETDRAVTVTLTRVPPKDTGEIACIDIALSKTVDIHLAHPLGNRVVRDGSTGKPVVRTGRVP